MRRENIISAGVIYGYGCYERDFRFADHHGKTHMLSDFHGNAVLLFFGSTLCPDICLNITAGTGHDEERVG
ncbi:MAG: SCO family protein [Sulfuricella sp.]